MKNVNRTNAQETAQSKLKNVSQMLIIDFDCSSEKYGE